MDITTDMALAVTELDSLDTPAWSWDDFFKGVAVGVALVGLAVT